MFSNNSQITEVKTIAKKIGVRYQNTDSADYVAFKCIAELLKRVEKLEKQLKRLSNDS